MAVQIETILAVDSMADGAIITAALSPVVTTPGSATTLAANADVSGNVTIAQVPSTGVYKVSYDPVTYGDAVMVVYMGATVGSSTLVGDRYQKVTFKAGVNVASVAGSVYRVAYRTGNWNGSVTNPWAGGVVPVEGDNIIINNGVTVTITSGMDLAIFGTFQTIGTGTLNIGTPGAHAFTVTNIPVGWVVEINYGTVTDNSGTMERNYGTVANNVGGTVTDNSGTVANNVGGTVTYNSGTVTDNYGTVTTNNGTVTDNSGTVANNSNGIVGNNHGTVEQNTGTITYNQATGSILNNRGGTVTNNVTGGYVGYPIATDSDGFVNAFATDGNTIQAAAAAALEALNLDHLAKTTTSSADMTTEVADGTILSRMLSKTSNTSTFDPTTDALEALADKTGGLSSADTTTACTAALGAATTGSETATSVARLVHDNLPVDLSGATNTITITSQNVSVIETP